MVNIPIVVGRRDGISWERLKEVKALWLIPAWIIWLLALAISFIAPDVFYPPLILTLLLTLLPLVYFTYKYFIPWLRLRLFSKISRLIKYEEILRSEKEVVYRNMDAQNILDAFEKGAGTFYMVYKEADEHLFYGEIEDQRIVVRIRDIGSKIMEMFESMIRSLGTAIDFTSAMSAFFLARIEDELLDKSAFDQLKIRYKEMSPELQAVKDGEFDLPIWEPVEEIEIPPGESIPQSLFRNIRKVGLLVVVSGLDVPNRITRDVETARRQHTILMRIKDMKNIKGMAEATTRMEKEILERMSEELAYDAESIKRVESLVLRFEEPERLDQAIDLYFPDIPPTSRRIMVNEIERAIERVVNEALASSITSLDEIKAALTSSLRDSLEKCLPSNLIDRLINQLERVLESSYVFRELGRYLEKKKDMWECSVDSLAEATKRAGEYFVEEVGRRTDADFFSELVAKLENGNDSIVSRIRRAISDIEQEIRHFREEVVGSLSEKELEELLNVLSRVNIELSSVLRPLEQLLGSSTDASERQARERLTNILRDEAKASRVFEILSEIRSRLSDTVESMDELRKSLEGELWERRKGRGGEGRQSSTDSRERENEVERLRQELDRLVSIVNSLREVLNVLSIPMEMMGDILSKRDEYKEKIELTMITKRALEYEIVKTLNSLARKDLRLFISSRLGNPLKELYIKWRERKIGWWA